MKELSPEQKQNTADLIRKAKAALVKDITEMASGETVMEIDLVTGGCAVNDIVVFAGDDAEGEEPGVLVHTTRCDDDGERRKEEFSLEDLDIGILNDIFRFLVGKTK